MGVNHDWSSRVFRALICSVPRMVSGQRPRVVGLFVAEAGGANKPACTAIHCKWPMYIDDTENVVYCRTMFGWIFIHGRRQLNPPLDDSNS